MRCALQQIQCPAAPLHMFYGTRKSRDCSHDAAFMIQGFGSSITPPNPEATLLHATSSQPQSLWGRGSGDHFGIRNSAQQASHNNRYWTPEWGIGCREKAGGIGKNCLEEHLWHCVVVVVFSITDLGCVEVAPQRGICHPKKNVSCVPCTFGHLVAIRMIKAQVVPKCVPTGHSVGILLVFNGVHVLLCNPPPNGGVLGLEGFGMNAPKRCVWQRQMVEL